jgi:hypothetical protein
MLNLVSILIGLITLPFALLSVIPLVGWLNWLIIPVALLGAGIGALSSRTSGRNLNIIVLLFGILRLWIGGGLI